MSPQRTEQITSYAAAYQLLLDGLGRFPVEMWQFRPDPDRWTIHEIIVHIADSEVNSYIRCRRLVAEPGSTVLGYDEVRWAKELDYHAQSPADALELFKWLRQKSAALIQSLPESAWANTVTHTENGPMSLDDWLDTYARHVPDHIQQMEANYSDWLALHPS